MAKILFFTKNKKQIETVTNVLQQHTVTSFSVEEEILDYFKKNDTDVIIIDTSKLKDAVNICRALKFASQIKNIHIIQLVNSKDKNKEFLKYAFSYVTYPLDEEILKHTVNSAILTKNSFDELAENNSELSMSLYRLDILTKTVTALSGSLDKAKIIEIMTDGIEKSLSYDLCYTLVCDEDSDITLSITSLHPISARLEEAIKCRAMLSFEDNINIRRKHINVKKYIKRPNEFEYDLKIIDNFDTALAHINVKEKFFGIIEVFKEKEFKSEDIRWLQTLVKQTTFPLQSAVLYEEIKEQNDKLEEIEKKKSEFFSIVSHELKTPLSTIQNAAKILLSGKIPAIPDRALGFAKMIERNGDKLLSLIKELLDSVKVEAGKIDYGFAVANVNPIVDFVKQNFTNLADEKSIKLLLEKEKVLPDLYIDTKRIEQVITNLFSNALKYTPNGGTIHIKTEIMPSEILRERPFSENKDRVIADEYVIVKVSDNGPGIAQEDISKIFEKFEQVKGTLSRSVGGTGLGLYIAKEFAKAHNGFLWLESVLGKGSDFYLAIPVLTPDECFEMQLKQDISNADVDKKSFYMITLCENKTNEKPYLAEFINKLDKENIFKKSIDSKVFFTETKERLYYSFYDVNMNLQIFNFVAQRIMDFAKKDEIIMNGKKIYFSQICYPDDAGDGEELIKKSKKLLKEVING